MQNTTDIEQVFYEKYSTFGGWLRFFQIINILWVVLIGLVITASLVFASLDYYEPHEYSDVFAAAFELTPEFVISIVTLGALARKSPTTPAKIVQNMGYYVWATLAVYFILYYLFKSGAITDKPITFWGAVIYYYIWSSYFKRSKRVKSYYGANCLD